MNYLIFSDESGMWKAGDYYIRSWIRTSPIDYELIRKDIVFIKHKMNLKELKWNSIKNNAEKIRSNIESLFSIEFSLFITISKPDHFKKRLENNRYNILTTLKGIEPEQSTGGEYFSAAIKEKIINAAQHTLFFNYFEKQHIENSKKAFVNDINNKLYKYIIDSPQCLDKDWEKIAEECGIVNLDIEKKSEKVSGIELADSIAGCINEHLNKDEKASEFYYGYIRKKMLDMASPTLPNPNLIFYSDFSAEEKENTNIFR
ncbi:MAG: hypothetical protein ACFFDT_04795 [Candidatus Hodarchaeota archaeon]